jgi:trigger factor
VKTTASELEGSRVRVQVEVDASQLDATVERKAVALARGLKLPGFRRGKVPGALVIQRLGREAVLEQAVRDALPGWYAQAIEATGIVPVGDPSIDLAGLPAEGEPLSFSIEIGVLPVAKLGDYDDLEVARREALAEDEQVDAELELVRERLARMTTVSRPAAQGDYLVADYRGWLARSGGGRGKAIPGGEARDRLVELGAGNLLPGFEEGLLGAGAGDSRTVEASFPADYPDRQLAGRDAVFEIAVKAVQEKQLPALDSDLASDAGFDSLDDLRADIRERLLRADEERVQAEFQRAALDAVAQRAEVALTEQLIKARAKEMWERMMNALAQRGISPETYAQVSGRGEQESVAELEADAERALRREAVLTAVVEAEGIAVSDEELGELLAPLAEREGSEGAELLARLRSAGRLEELREEEAVRRAMKLLAERARPVSVAQAQAKDRLWTPGQEPVAEPAGAAAPGELWTPASGPSGR